MCSIPGLPSPGSNVTVIITRVNVNPLCVLAEFWGNFAQDQKPYYQLKKEIQFPGDAFHEIEGRPGDLCLVQVHETWYRARIVSRIDAHYNVFLIDEGKTLQVHTSSLAWGQTDFFNLSPEVEFCILSNVLPLSAKNRWSKLALEFMKSFCGKAVKACVLDFVIPQRVFLLDIPCLSGEMQKMGFAKKLSNEEFKAFVLRYLHCDTGSVEPLKIGSMGFKPIKTRYMYPELQAKTTETVLITEVINPLRVFCQLKVFSQELKKLTEQITQHYERTIGSSFASPENLGASCASKGADGKWYRSVLQQVRPTNNVVEVLHVDYGKKQIVPVDYVRPLAPEFFQMPVVTYVCSLHGVVDHGVGWTVSQIDYLKSLLLNRTVIAKFKYQSLSEGVYYVTLYGDENTNINRLFASRENCSIDSMCLKDYTIHKIENSRGDFQRCQISVKGEAEETEYIKGILTETLSLNTDHVAVVQHVDSPSKFWIQTQKYAAEFDMLMDGLTELYSDLSGVSGMIREPEAGRLCVAKAKDGVFYRATVCEIAETKTEVFFLDYGNKEWVECSNLRELPLRYYNIPALAIKCALYGIQPKSKEWDLNATIFFAKAVMDKVLNVHVLAKSQDTYLVKVINSLSSEERDFSKLLCSVGFAYIKAMDVSPVTTPYSKLVHTSDIFKTASSSSSFTEYFFPIGSSFDVTVSSIESPNDFWCQKVNDAKCLKLLTHNLQRYYANSEFQPLLEAACVARHPENGMWFRALVIQKLQACHLTVLFVDYGETKRVPIHDLRRIDPVFLQLKGQAFRCCLYNLNYSASYSSSVWSPEATKHFREFVDQAASMNVVLKCTVYAVMCDSRKIAFNVVDLESPFQSLCQLLVQRGLSEDASKTVSLPPLRLDTYFYSSHGIKIGSEDDVCITCAKNVNHFFCHLQRNSMQIDKLTDKVNSLCRQLQSNNCSETFENVCFARYTDGLWYRGQLKSTKPLFFVHFVDYGYTQQVEKSDLLPVPVTAAEIMAISVQAIECGLSDVPENVPSRLNIWFKSFVTNRQLKALIVAKEPCGKLIVQLYDGKTSVNALIREKFHIEFERSEQITVEADVNEQHGSYNVAEIQKIPQWTSEKHWRVQKGADSEKCLRKLMDVPYVHGNLCIPKQTELPLKVVTPGLVSEVFISHCNSPLSFFVQLVADENDICSLVEKLNEDQSNHVPVNPGDLHKGDLVSAMYPDDSCWYRAVVRKALVGDTADVEFIDFGNTAEVSVLKICLLDKIFFLPRYSIHCSLTEVNFDCDMAFNFKTKIVKNADRFLCKFVQQSDSVWEVELNVNGKVLGASLLDDTNSITVTNIPRSPDTNFNICTYKNPDISTGKTFAVYASVIIGPQFFWCQYAEPIRLQEISYVIQTISSNLKSKDFDVETLPIGSGCIALFDEDQIWYRAQLTSSDKDTHTVLFVDYGNESKVKIGGIRPLPSEVSDIPPQAFACQLDGFNVLEGSWDDKAAEQFFELINDQPLKVTILKLSGSSDMMTPHCVKLEREEIIINDAMRKYWIQNSMRTSIELKNAQSETYLESNATPSICVTKPKDPLCADVEEIQVPYSLKMQEECDGTLGKHEKQAEFTELPQYNRKLTLLDIVKPQTCVQKFDVRATDVNTDILDIRQHSQPADVHDECLLDSIDLSKEALAGSPEHTNENQLEAVKTASPGGQSCDQLRENVYEAISEHKESKTESDPEIIKSDLGILRRLARSISVGSECAIGSHGHKHGCRAQIVKVSNDSTMDETEHKADTCVASQDLSDLALDEEVYKPNDEVELGSEQQTQDMKLDSCLGNLVSTSKKTLQKDANQYSGSDFNASQKMSKECVGDFSLEQHAIEMDPKTELAPNVCSAVVQVVKEKTSPSAEEQREHVNKMCELMDAIMDFLPLIPLETDQDAESKAETELDICGVVSQKKLDDTGYKAVACYLPQQPTEITEKPGVGVEHVITQKQAESCLNKNLKYFIQGEPGQEADGDIWEHQSQAKESDPCSGDLVAENNKLVQDDVTQDPDLGHDTPREMNKMFGTDFSAKQSVEGKTFEQVEELMAFIPAVTLQKDQEADAEAGTALDTNGVMSQQKGLDVELDAVLEVNADVTLGKTEQWLDTTSDLLNDNIVDTELVAADMVSSDLQKSPNAEELEASTITHLTLRIADTSDDDICVKEWRVSPTRENKPSSPE